MELKDEILRQIQIVKDSIASLEIDLEALVKKLNL